MSTRIADIFTSPVENEVRPRMTDPTPSAHKSNTARSCILAVGAELGGLEASPRRKLTAVEEAASDVFFLDLTGPAQAEPAETETRPRSKRLRPLRDLVAALPET